MPFYVEMPGEDGSTSRMKAVVEAVIVGNPEVEWPRMIPVAPPEFKAGWPAGWPVYGEGDPEWIETPGPARLLSAAEHRRLTGLTRMLRDRPVTDSTDIQVYVPASLRPLLGDWLAARGLHLFQIPSEDPVPTFGIGHVGLPPLSDLELRDLRAAGPRPLPAFRYEASAGIRAPSSAKSGRKRVRGVAYEIVQGGGMELWSCDHDHAPGVRDMQKLLPSQRETAVACAEEWLIGEVTAGRLPVLPVLRAEAT